MKQVEVYTDGACSHNPGPGGWGVVLIYGPHIKELSGFEPHSTNQRMELTAAIKGLEQLKERTKVRLYSDSAYLINAFNLGWIDNWQKNGWRNSRGNPVSNSDLWKALIELSEKHEIEWIKVKGHSTDKWNNRCDELAKEAIRRGMN